MDEKYVRALVAVFLEDTYRMQNWAPHIPMRQLVKWQIFSGIGKPVGRALAYFLQGHGQLEDLDPDLLQRAASYVEVPAAEISAESFRRARQDYGNGIPRMDEPDDEVLDPYQEIMLAAFRRTFPDEP